MGIKNREYCITIHKMNIEDASDWCEKNCSAWILSEEVGKEGKLHLQGLIQFQNPRSYKAVSKALGNCHTETIHKKSSIKNAYEYCLKGTITTEPDGETGLDAACQSEDYLRFVEIMKRNPIAWEGGEFNWKTDQGKRSDLELVHEMVEDGSNMREIISQAKNYQGIKTAEKLLEYFEKPRDFKPEVYWFWGKTETGKSKTARELAGDDYYEGNYNGKWWNGYDGHHSVIIDDFRYNWKDFADMLKMLDRYGYRVKTKGGMRQLVAKKIFITCPYTPRVAYKYNCDEDLCQLERRITEIRRFGSGTEVLEQKSGEVILDSPSSSETAEEF